MTCSCLGPVFTGDAGGYPGQVSAEVHEAAQERGAGGGQEGERGGGGR
jgi:hypothetical protein